MKKILGILILAVLLIFAAGCVTTAEEDEVVGTWTETSDYEGMIEEYTLVLEANGTGVSTLEYTFGEDKSRYISPVQWYVSDGHYAIEEINSVKLEDDGTMTDFRGYVYEKSEGGDGAVGVWTETPREDVYYVYTFNEDGTGVEALWSGGDVSEDPILWRADENLEGIMLYWYIHTYSTTEEGILIDGEHRYESAGQGEFVHQAEDHTDMLVFYEEELCVRTVTAGDRTSVKYYSWVESDEIGYRIVHGDLFGFRPLSTMIDEGVLIYESWCVYVLEEDGTLVCQEHGSVLTKTA